MRSAVERSLTEPRKFGDSARNRGLEPPYGGDLHVERVEVTGSDEAPSISVVFYFGDRPELFGIVYPVLEMYQDGLDGYISIYIAEQLFALGFGIDNARKVRQDGVTWLKWNAWWDAWPSSWRRAEPVFGTLGSGESFCSANH
jgi:hypothetical protein